MKLYFYSFQVFVFSLMNDIIFLIKLVIFLHFNTTDFDNRESVSPVPETKKESLHFSFTCPFTAPSYTSQ